MAIEDFIAVINALSNGNGLSPVLIIHFHLCRNNFMRKLNNSEQ